MTPEERQMLNDLANRVTQTPAPPIDKEAEEFIRTRIGSRPDALYLMTQTVLIQNMALERAQQQIQQLQQAAQASGSQQPSTSFLPGHGSSHPPGPEAQRPTPNWQSAAPPSQQEPTQRRSGWFGGTGGSNANPIGGGGGFLRGAAQTAAGVAAGALAFEGIRSLFGGLEHGFGGSGFMGGYGAPVEETVVNNYYDSPDDATDHGADPDTQDAGFYDDSGSDVDDTSYDDGGDLGDDDSGSFLA